MGKVSCLTYFLLELGCENYSHLDQAVEDFEQGLECILCNSIKKAELDASLDESNAIISSVSSGLYSVNTLSDNSKLQLVPSVKSHKCWCQDRTLLLPVAWE